jgi:putative flippase GtrA
MGQKMKIQKNYKNNLIKQMLTFVIDKKKELILYLVFGVLTTVVNFVVYYVLTNPLNVYYLLSNLIAWVAAVLFAYFTNRVWVFDCKTSTVKQMITQASLFFSARITSLLVDMGLMYALVSLLLIDDLISKVIVGVTVVIINYVLSKLIIFKKPKVRNI